MPTLRRASLTAALVATLFAVPVSAGDPPPAPPYPPAPRAYPQPPPRPRYEPPRVAAPPPLSPAIRVIYAPFYAAGLVLRYGLYYGVVAPLEVFQRAVTYGASGGVERRPPPSDGEEPDER